MPELVLQLHRLHQVLLFGGTSATMWCLWGRRGRKSTSVNIFIGVHERICKMLGEIQMSVPWLLMELNIGIILLGMWENKGENQPSARSLHASQGHLFDWFTPSQTEGIFIILGSNKSDLWWNHVVSMSEGRTLCCGVNCKIIWDFCGIHTCLTGWPATGQQGKGEQAGSFLEFFFWLRKGGRASPGKQVFLNQKQVKNKAEILPWSLHTLGTPLSPRCLPWWTSL